MNLLRGNAFLYISLILFVSRFTEAISSSNLSNRRKVATARIPAPGYDGSGEKVNDSGENRREIA